MIMWFAAPVAVETAFMAPIRISFRPLFERFVDSSPVRPFVGHGVLRIRPELGGLHVCLEVVTPPAHHRRAKDRAGPSRVGPTGPSSLPGFERQTKPGDVLYARPRIGAATCPRSGVSRALEALGNAAQEGWITLEAQRVDVEWPAEESRGYSEPVQPRGPPAARKSRSPICSFGRVGRGWRRPRGGPATT